MRSYTVRLECAGDEAAIGALTARAFAHAEHSDGTEGAIVEGLRASHDLALSLVADCAGAIIGHAAFSPVTIGDAAAKGWFGLGPISVDPPHQRRGVGGALIKRGLALLEANGARGVVVLGDPAYYARFGFKNDPALTFPGPPAEYFQCLLLTGDPPAGTVRYAPAFG